MISTDLVLMATPVSLASICVGADGHVNLELRLWADCEDASPAPSAALEDVLPEASPCCGPCLHVGGDDEEWLTAGAPTAKRPLVLCAFEAYRPPAFQAVASNLLLGFARALDRVRELASVVIRC